MELQQRIQHQFDRIPSPFNTLLICFQNSSPLSLDINLHASFSILFSPNIFTFFNFFSTSISSSFAISFVFLLLLFVLSSSLYPTTILFSPVFPLTTPFVHLYVLNYLSYFFLCILINVFPGFCFISYICIFFLCN